MTTTNTTKLTASLLRRIIKEEVDAATTTPKRKRKPTFKTDPLGVERSIKTASRAFDADIVAAAADFINTFHSAIPFDDQNEKMAQLGEEAYSELVEDACEVFETGFRDVVRDALYRVYNKLDMVGSPDAGPMGGHGY